MGYRNRSFLAQSDRTTLRDKSDRLLLPGGDTRDGTIRGGGGCTATGLARASARTRTPRVAGVRYCAVREASRIGTERGSTSVTCVAFPGWPSDLRVHEDADRAREAARDGALFTDVAGRRFLDAVLFAFALRCRLTEEVRSAREVDAARPRSAPVFLAVRLPPGAFCRSFEAAISCSPHAEKRRGSSRILYTKPHATGERSGPN